MFINYCLLVLVFLVLLVLEHWHFSSECWTFLCIQAEGYSSTEHLCEVLRGAGVHAETEVTVFLTLSDVLAFRCKCHEKMHCSL